MAASFLTLAVIGACLVAVGLYLRELFNPYSDMEIDDGNPEQ
jgi:UTP:GlnB (protein PII) uridylyltransferase